MLAFVRSFGGATLCTVVLLSVPLASADQGREE